MKGLLKYWLPAFVLWCTSAQSVAQQIDHWETIVYDSMKWRYWEGNADPGINWYVPGFNDSGWQEGRGSIGYGDNDDRTLINPALSVFLRRKFTITNLSEIKEAILHVDFDDGFIAYINGVEVARAFMPDGIVNYNQGSNGLHEALIYQGLPPEYFSIPSSQLSSLLVNGENTLAIQVHNENISSSDLTSSVFFSVGVTSTSFTYLPTPTWFVEPTDLISNLPIIIINTNGQTIQDDNRIIAHMGIIDNGEGVTNHFDDIFNNYDGRISIETRGESSQGFPKKSFRLETQDAMGNNLNAALLGMPPENDWVLYAPYSDKSMMRNVLAYKLGRDFGNYAPRTRFAELVINGNYEGVYVLIEKIKRDNNRVNIATLNPEDISGDEITGGYILRVDKLDGTDYPGWTATPTPQLAGERDFTFQYFDPKGDELVELQRNYIRNYIRTFQSSLTSTDYKNISTGYRRYIDVPSALNFMLVNEIAKNVDGYIFSTYLYKEKDSDGGKLFMGPLWDFNLTFGNVDYWQNSQIAPGWIYNDSQRMFWFRRMVSDPLFFSNLKCRWQELRSGFLTNDYFTNTIDSIANVLEEAQQRNYARWPVLGTYVWPNQYVGQTYSDEIAFLKQWIQNRLNWMDTNLSGECTPATLVTEVEELLTDINVYPNPFEGNITIQYKNSNEIKFLQIFDSTGRLVFSDAFTSYEYRWQGITNLGFGVPPGLYVLQVYNVSGKLIGMKKIIRR